MKKFLVVCVVAVSFISVFSQNLPHAHAATPWYDGCLTKQYGWGEGANQEHGNDVSCFGYGTPITALLSGVVSFAGWTPFGGYCEVTWKLDNPGQAHGAPYAYVEDMSRCAAYKGERVSVGQILGYSMSWVEFGLTPDWAYGISNWRWGPNSLFLILEARNGKTITYQPPTTTNSGGGGRQTYVCDCPQDHAEARAIWNRALVSGHHIRNHTGIELQFGMRIAADMRVPGPTSQEYTVRGQNGKIWVMQNFGSAYVYIHDPVQNRGNFYSRSTGHVAFALQE